MSDDPCHELDTIVSSLRLDGPDPLDRLGRLPGVEACIAAGLRRSAAADDWASFERYVLAASCRPDPSMVGVLCEVLGRHSDRVNNEDIVELLGMIADASAVGCLEEALSWEPPWDEYRNLAVKAVWALGAIGDAKALEVLRDAASCSSVEVREAAARELDRRSG